MRGTFDIDDPLLLAQEIAAGEGRSLPKIARTIGTNPSTIYRWATKGFPDGHGGRVRLECVRKGRQLVTTLAAYERMLAALPRTTSADQAPPLSPRTPSARSRHRERVHATEQVHRQLGI